MEPRDIGNYGGVRVDAKPQQNPESEVDAAKFNRLCEDTAQLTRPPYKGIVWFDSHTFAGAHTYATADVNCRSQWGTGDAQKPQVSQTAAGRYTLTWQASYSDDLSVSESVALVVARVSCYSSDPADTFYDCRPLTITSNAITIVTKAGGAAADVGDNSGANFQIEVEFG
jgi:hypothetical protein